MLVRGTLSVLLLVWLPSAAWCQPQPSLQDAERALGDALLRHDQRAFVDLLASDAVFFLPTESHGADAIVRAWLPFLVDVGVTMVMTTESAVIGKSGDLAQSTGRFAIKGPTDHGISTIPAGTYSAVWRLIDGRWRLTTLAGAGNGRVNMVVRGGVGGFRFGMSRTEVSGVSDCQPYTNVARTGGLECPNFTFEGQKMNISFIFASDHLRRIQLWFYEGESETEAHDAVARVIEYLQRMAGGVHIAALPGQEVTPDGVMSMLNGPPVRPGYVTQFELSTPAGSQREVWFSRVARHQFGYAVMLFADPREGR